MSGLLGDVRAVLDLGVRRAGDHPVGAHLQAVADGLDRPLRVAVVGRVKAGKSTLVNAMVGELVAPTDARECTRIVTWYRDGLTYRVEGVTTEGATVALRHDRDDAGLHVDLGGHDETRFSSLHVDFPSAPLRELTLVDTPGLSSLDAAAGDRTVGFVTGGDAPAGCDAVLHLLRHVHADDVRFLEAFHDDEFATTGPVNAIGVLSRADEIGAARPDALDSAARIAQRWCDDPRLATLVNTVVPVAGLLAQAARTFGHHEFQAFATLARTDAPRLEALLLSVDRFASEAAEVDVSGAERAGLLDRFGFFGCRTAVAYLQDRPDAGPAALAGHLLEVSGLPGLRELVAERFGRRAGLLRARNGLAAARRAAAVLGDRDLAVAVERLGANSHDLAEADLAEALRRGIPGLEGAAAAEAARLLGDHGLDPAVRSGAGDGADLDQVRAALVDQHARWQRRMAHPLATHESATAAAVLVRTCEGLLASLTSVPFAPGRLTPGPGDGPTGSDQLQYPTPVPTGPTTNR